MTFYLPLDLVAGLVDQADQAVLVEFSDRVVLEVLEDHQVHLRSPEVEAVHRKACSPSRTAAFIRSTAVAFIVCCRSKSNFRLSVPLHIYLAKSRSRLLDVSRVRWQKFGSRLPLDWILLGVQRH